MTAGPPGVRFGGAWMFIAEPNISLVTAIVQRSSSMLGSGAASMAVPFLG